MKDKKHGGIKVLKPYTKGLEKFYLLAAIAVILKVVINFAIPQVVKVTVDSVIDNNPLVASDMIKNVINFFGGIEFAKSHMWVPAIYVVVLAIMTGIADYFSRVLVAKGSEGIIKNLRNKLYDHIQRLPFKWHSNNKTGDTIQRVTQDVDIIRRFIAIQVVDLFRISMLVVIALIMMFNMNVKLTLIALIFIPAVIFYSAYFHGKISKQFKKADEAEGDMYSVAQENLTGVRVVRAFGREKYELEKFAEKNKKFSDLWIGVGKQLSAFWSVGDFFSAGQVLAVLTAGAFETVNGNISLGGFLAFVSYNAMLVWPIRGFGRVLSELSKAGVSLKRVDEILLEEEEKDSENAVEVELNKNIVFDNVRFGYDDNEEILKGVSFEIEAGSTFAILGKTGSGKSTIMHLMNRLYDIDDDKGSICIGDTDIRNIKLSHLRSNIGIVLQEPFLFSKTLKENIGITMNKLDMDIITEATNIACVHDSIKGFSKGYETEIGERGVTLSGGQKQRVAISRMLTQGTPIMIFDDSLSAVDTETDANIRNALKNKRQDTTTILISHRITTLMQADKILVLDKGRVLDIGSHQELITREGVYKDIFEIQTNKDDIN